MGGMLIGEPRAKNGLSVPQQGFEGAPCADVPFQIWATLGGTCILGRADHWVVHGVNATLRVADHNYHTFGGRSWESMWKWTCEKTVAEMSSQEISVCGSLICPSSSIVCDSERSDWACIVGNAGLDMTRYPSALLLSCFVAGNQTGWRCPMGTIWARPAKPDLGGRVLKYE